MLIVFFNAFPALNTGAFDAGIFISTPVCGFLPVLATLFFTSKVPKPINCTFSSFFNVSDTTSTKAFIPYSAIFFDVSVFSDIAFIKSALFIDFTTFFYTIKYHLLYLYAIYQRTQMLSTNLVIFIILIDNLTQK